MITATNLLQLRKINNNSQKTDMVVQKTTNLDLFHLVKGNRAPNIAHVKKLAESIKKYGMLANPIIVNEKLEVVDGQHRLLAAKEANSHVYYIVVTGYTLDQIHALNLNQKNWNLNDFMDSYADMGYEDYIILRNFYRKHQVFALGECISMCGGVASHHAYIKNYRYSTDKVSDKVKVFNEGTFKVGDMKIAEQYAENLKKLQPFYSKYNQSRFVSSMLALFRNKNFVFSEFLSKLKLQPTALVDCATREQFNILIEEIYNYHRRDKVNLRFQS